jgi:hypothetical protein
LPVIPVAVQLEEHEHGRHSGPTQGPGEPYRGLVLQFAGEQVVVDAVQPVMLLLNLQVCATIVPGVQVWGAGQV